MIHQQGSSQEFPTHSSRLHPHPYISGLCFRSTAFQEKYTLGPDSNIGRHLRCIVCSKDTRHNRLHSRRHRRPFPRSPAYSSHRAPRRMPDCHSQYISRCCCSCREWSRPWKLSHYTNSRNLSSVSFGRSSLRFHRIPTAHICMTKSLWRRARYSARSCIHHSTYHLSSCKRNMCRCCKSCLRPSSRYRLRLRFRMRCCSSPSCTHRPCSIQSRCCWRSAAHSYSSRRGNSPS